MHPPAVFFCPTTLPEPPANRPVTHKLRHPTGAAHIMTATQPIGRNSRKHVDKLIFHINKDGNHINNDMLACSAGRAVSDALDSDLGHRVVLPLTCGLFGYMAYMSVTQCRQHTAEEPLVGQGGQKRAFHKPMIVH